MSILDDAIREHLELKRQHGADDSELKQLEDEAFGPAERPSAEQALPDPAAEAPTEFMTPPPEVGEAGDGSRREPAPGIADLQEAPEQAQPREPDSAEEDVPVAVEPDSAEEPVPAEEDEVEPAEEEHPAMEYEAVLEEPAEPAPSPEHSTEERHAIAEHPTELYDVEGEIAASDSRSPSDEELVEEEMLEPRLTPADPLAGLEDVDEDDVSVEGRAQDTATEADDEEDDFFDEQRLSEELDQALEAPAPASAAPVELEPLPELDEGEDVESDFDDDEEDSEEHVVEERDQPTGDVLGGTPDFLEETPEDDQLWFEQKPPKDFDFDD
jgi:hypothetical protein